MIEVKKIQPMYERLLTKLKIHYKKEYGLGSKRIDYMFIVNGQSFGLEVKQSEKWHSEKNQLEGYRKLARNKKYGLDHILLSDPKGKHKDKGSISIKALESLLKGLK